MKKLFFTLILMVFCTTLNAQSSSNKKMEETIAKVEKAKTANDYSSLFDEFSKLTKANSDEKWKAYYYSAFVKYKEVEALFVNKNFTELNDRNWLAYKYITSISDQKKDHVEVQKLLGLINEQQQKIQKLR